VNVRVVTVRCADWPLTAAGVPPDAPALVLHANRVLVCSPAATAEGVRPGQRRREAQRLCPDAAIVAADPDRDARAFEPVIAAVERFAPRFEVVEPGWIALAARGPSRYFGGEQSFTAQLGTAIVAASPAARVQIGVADGRFAAAIAAQQARPGQPVLVPRGATPAFLAPLPAGWLHRLGEADPDLVGLFARLGLTTLGALAELPVADVLARFGPAGRHARLLAEGSDGRALHAAEPPTPRHAEIAFDAPVTELAALAFSAKQLADRLAAELAAEGLVCTRLVVTAETEHGERSERVWFRAAGMPAMAMVERVRWQLAAWATTGQLTAGVVLLRLAPDEVRADTGHQVGMWGERPAADEQALRAVARLAGLAGDEAVTVPAWHGGRLPGDRYRWVPATSADLTEPGPRLGGSSDQAPWPGAMPAPSPAVVPAEPAEAALVDATGETVRVTGRGELCTPPAALQIGRRPPQAVTQWAGPWLVDERWWDAGRHRRLARLQVVTADGSAHLVAAERQRWWLLATYD